MSKTDELKKKMRANPVAFTPRQSIAVRPIPDTHTNNDAVPTQEAPKASKKKQSKEMPQQELASLFAKIPKEDKRWLDHHRIDTGKELGEIITEAIQMLKKRG